jgi:hypothetical protein
LALHQASLPFYSFQGAEKQPHLESANYNQQPPNPQ